VTDGGFRPDGTLVSWPVHDSARLTEAFRRAVLRLFVRHAATHGGGPSGPLSITATPPRGDCRRARGTQWGRPALAFRPARLAGTADRTARAAHERGGGHAADSPSEIARPAIPPSAQPTPIAIPIPQLA
jgi:hypothetical protein